ncbi:MAG: PadR family transcriptional regulator [Lachnospiraceae bacterium]|nr:PadR family transcriptional regulator [Lachnospiraceae bacterium]
MTDRYEKQLKKGILEILVLKLLEREEKYGYQLIQELRDKSDGMFTLKEGTLYPILYRLEEETLIASRWSEPKGKEVARKYYAITPEGREVLGRLIGLWKEFSGQVSGILEED